MSVAPLPSSGAIRVLIIEDTASVRESLRIALESASMEVTVAENGRHGLACLAQNHFDAVVTDLWMPEIDGLNVLKRLRSERPEVRLFAITGGGPQLTIEAADSLAQVWGAERVFVKPFDESLLVDAIRSAPPKGV